MLSTRQIPDTPEWNAYLAEKIRHCSASQLFLALLSIQPMPYLVFLSSLARNASELMMSMLRYIAVASISSNNQISDKYLKLTFVGMVAMTLAYAPPLLTIVAAKDRRLPASIRSVLGWRSFLTGACFVSLLILLVGAGFLANDDDTPIHFERGKLYGNKILMGCVLNYVVLLIFSLYLKSSSIRSLKQAYKVGVTHAGIDMRGKYHNTALDRILLLSKLIDGAGYASIFLAANAKVRAASFLLMAVSILSSLAQVIYGFYTICCSRVLFRNLLHLLPVEAIDNSAAEELKPILRYMNGKKSLGIVQQLGQFGFVIFLPVYLILLMVALVALVSPIVQSNIDENIQFLFAYVLSLGVNIIPSTLSVLLKVGIDLENELTQFDVARELLHGASSSTDTELHYVPNPLHQVRSP